MPLLFAVSNNSSTLHQIASVRPDSADQPGAEGQHQHSAAVLQQLADRVHFETHHHFKGGHDQGHDDHLGQLLLEAVEGIDVEQVAAQV